MPRPVVGNADMHYVSQTDYLNDFEDLYPWTSPGDVRDLWGGESPPNLWVQAVDGVATFDTEMIFMQPTVAIENSSGYPYGTGDPYAACCPMSMVASLPTGENVASEAFHVFHDAQKLELVEDPSNPFPTTWPEGSPLPDLEVRIMTSTTTLLDQGLDAPIYFPLTHGPDVDVYIELTISWDKKVFAGSAPNATINQYGMDLSPLLGSAIVLDGDGVTMNHQDDLVIRKRSTKLPAGHYGAIFTGINLKNVTEGVRLNFTMIYPGALTDSYAQVNAIPPPAFSRVGLGHLEFERIWEDSTAANFFEYGVAETEEPAYLFLYQEPVKANDPDGDKWCGDKCSCPGPSNTFVDLIHPDNPLYQWIDMCTLNETLAELADQLYSTGTWYQEEYGGAARTGIKSLLDAPQRLYRDYGNAAVKVSSSKCSGIVEQRRREWCEQSGFTMDVTADVGPGVFLTEPIEITARKTAALTLAWDRTADVNEVHAHSSLTPIVLQVLDSNGNRITTGNESSFAVTAAATAEVDGNDVPVVLCINGKASCRGMYCSLEDTLQIEEGQLLFSPGICDQYYPGVDHKITFGITDADGNVLQATTATFQVTDEIPVGVLVPMEEKEAIGPSIRAIRHMAEVGFRGFNLDHTFVDSRLEVGSAYYGEDAARSVKQIPHYIYLSGTATEQIEQIRGATEHYGIRQFLGPFDIETAGQICTWLSTEMPHITAFLPTLSGDSLHGSHDNCVKLVPSLGVQTKAFVAGIKARGWTSIAVVQDRSQRGLAKDFYDALSIYGIKLLADVDVSPDMNMTMAEHMAILKTSGARIVYSAMVGTQSSAVYTAAVAAQLTAADGIQWIGDDEAFKNFKWEEIPEPGSNFEGAAFLSLAHGLSSKNVWFKMCYGLTGTSSELFTSRGGMDPLYTSFRGFDFFDLGVWERSDYLYVADTVSLMSQLAATLIKLDLAVNAPNLRSYMEQQRLGGAMSTWLFNGWYKFDEYMSSTKLTATWAQLKAGDLNQLSMDHSNLDTVLEFNPWIATEGILLDNDAYAEGQVPDMQTSELLPKASWSPKVNVTLRTYTGYPDGLGQGVPDSGMTDMVPITHDCKLGCGGGHKAGYTGKNDSTASFYEFENGVCEAPDTCTCSLRTEAQTPAYDGPACEDTVCDEICVKGSCIAVKTCADEVIPATNVTNSSILTVCSLDTRCECDAGWTGAACDVAVCDLHGCSAQHGSCQLPDTCVCEEGFYSQDCNDKCACLSGSCNDGASGTGDCTCFEGYFGAICDDDCTCLQGICNDGADGDGTCRSCSDGWIGPDCDVPCTCENGDCQDGINGNGMCSACDSGWLGDNCDLSLVSVAVPAALGAVLVIALFVWIGKFFMKRARDAAMLANTDWKVKHEDISHQKDKATQESLMFQSMKFQSTAGFGAQSTTSLGPQTAQSMNKSVGKYRDTVVHIKSIDKATIEITPQLRQEVKAVREAIHPNLCSFVGMCLDAPNACILTVFAGKGSLDDVLASEDIRLPWEFRDSIIKDIARGMQFLAKGVLKSHGRLKSSNCVVDNRWTVKITDFGLQTVRLGQDKDLEQITEDMQAHSLLWTAPELLKTSKSLDDVGAGTPEGDVYSFGILMNEVMTREMPFDDVGLAAEEMIPLIASSKPAPAGMVAGMKSAWPANTSTSSAFEGESAKLIRPSPPTDMPESKNYVVLARQCWANNPEDRPTMNEVVRSLAKISPQKGEMVDNLIKMLEKYATGLEAIVAKRTSELEGEKQKVEDLVCKMLPKKIVEDLKVGKDVKAESFENVTIFFSDIVGFTSICSKSEPLQVVDLLNDLYTTFDTIIDEYDVYKVETIGDAYMVVSGLPERNGDRHAGEIGSMALHLLSAMKDFKIRHMPEITLQLRVGLHSGPVVAGVVGVKMPRYCLFGDTVNIASRMESGGLALKCHISETTASLLTKLGGYHLNCRGVREIKGKGEMKTYWLTGRDGFAHSLPDESLAVSLSQHNFK